MSGHQESIIKSAIANVNKRIKGRVNAINLVLCPTKMAAPDKELGYLERILDYLRDCKTLVEQIEIIDGLSESHPSIFEFDSFCQESFVLTTIRLLKIDSSSSFVDGVSNSLVCQFDHFALLNASFICLKELGSSPSKVPTKISPSFIHEVTTLQVASSIILRLVFDDKARLWDIGHESIDGNRLFSMLLSVPGFVSRAYRRLKVRMPPGFIPELFQEKLIDATMDHQVFPTVVRFILRRNKGRAIGPGLAAAEHHHLAAANERLQASLSDREKAEFVHCILEFSVLHGSSMEKLQELCSSLISTSLEECCKQIVLSSAVSLDVARSNTLSSSLAVLCKRSGALTNQIEDDNDWQDELARVDVNDHTLWRALIEVSTVWSSTVYVRQSDHTCQSRATAFIINALDIVDTNPMPLESIVPMHLMSGVSVRLNSTHKSIRFDGMRVGERLAKLLGEEVLFDELHSDPTERPSAALSSYSSEVDLYQATYRREDDDSSEGSLSFQTFDLEDDQEDLMDVQRPLYLSECLSYFRTPETEDNALVRIEVALKSVTKLVRARPVDLQDHAPELARTILHLENKSNMDCFEEVSADALCSLVAMAPLAVGTCLIEELFLSDCSFATRLAALHALSNAAAEFSGIRADDDSISFPLSRARLLNDSTAQTPSVVPPATGRESHVREQNSWNSSILTDVLPIWFYTISKNFVSSVEDESLWGGEIGALLVTNVIQTMSCIVFSVADYSSAVDIIAMDFFRFVWNLKDAETPEVRSAVIQAVGVVIGVVSVDLKMRLLHDDNVDGLLSTLVRSSESDPDERCRAAAELTVGRITAAFDNGMIMESYTVQ